LSSPRIEILSTVYVLDSFLIRQRGTSLYLGRGDTKKKGQAEKYIDMENKRTELEKAAK
jgi:hypothetical protein